MTIHVNQQQSETAYVRQREYGLDPESISGHTKFNGDFLVQGYICGKISSKSDHSLRRYEPNCVKNALSRNFEESLKKFLDPDPEADGFKKSTSSFLCTDTVVLCKVANRQTYKQTNKQRDKRRALHNVLGGPNDTAVDWESG